MMQQESDSSENSEFEIEVLGDDGNTYFVDQKSLRFKEEPKKEYSTEVDKDELRELVTQIIAFNVDSYDELNALAGIPYEELQKMTPEQRHQKQIEMQESFNIPA